MVRDLEEILGSSWSFSQRERSTEHLGSVQIPGGKLSRTYQKVSSGYGPLYLQCPITWPTPRKEDLYHNLEFFLHPVSLPRLDFRLGISIGQESQCFCYCSPPKYHPIPAERGLGSCLSMSLSYPCGPRTYPLSG